MLSTAFLSISSFPWKTYFSSLVLKAFPMCLLLKWVYWLPLPLFESHFLFPYSREVFPDIIPSNISLDCTKYDYCYVHIPSRKNRNKILKSMSFLTWKNHELVINNTLSLQDLYPKVLYPSIKREFSILIQNS